tara:strand:+ start:967 stop:1224 length:258 start_codon:yes stop_codon:yes gene_type:complete
MTFNAWQLTGVKNMGNPEDYKVDPLSIHVDQRKKDTRRDAWDRDIMPADWIKPEPKTTKKISNAAPVLVFAFFYICILVMMGSIR